MRLVLTLLIGASWLAGAALAADAPTQATPIQSLTPEEFAKAGLNKLTPEELSFLEEALARHQPGLAQAIPVPEAPKEKIVKSTDKAAASFGAEQVTREKKLVTDQELHAHIEGTVESFTGRAAFVLDNGQIWQLRMPDTIYFTPKLENPEVIITRGLMGYKMVVVEANRVVFVKRIQ